MIALDSGDDGDVIHPSFEVNRRGEPITIDPCNGQLPRRDSVVASRDHHFADAARLRHSVEARNLYLAVALLLPIDREVHDECANLDSVNCWPSRHSYSRKVLRQAARLELQWHLDRPDTVLHQHVDAPPTVEDD